MNHSEVKNIAAISKAIGSRPTEAIVALPASALLEIASRSQQAGRRFGLARPQQLQ